MFKRKQDVDRHVSSILRRINEEKERYERGYQIARLYFEVKEFDIARRYLASFLNVKPSVPQAFRLLGQIEEAVGNKDNAVEAYKKFLDMGGQGKEVVLKICELYAELEVDPGVGKYWMEKAEKLYPQNDIIFKLKEKLIKSSPGENAEQDLESLISSELVKKPKDIDLRIKLLRFYLSSNRLEEAYKNAVETDRITAFSCLDWYECLHDVFKAYQSERDTRQDETFAFHYLVVLCHLTYLRLSHKDVAESTEALHSFDLTVHAALNTINSTEQWDAFITEMQGQLFFFAGTLLIKRAQKGSLSFKDVRPQAAVLYLLCQTVPTVDAQATWFLRPTQDREKIYSWLYKNSFFRISQSGHSLYQLCQGDSATWAHDLQLQCCIPECQERVYENLFPVRTMRASSTDSYLMNTHKFCNTNLVMPPQRQLYDVDRVAHTFHSDNLSHLVWLGLQQYAFGDPHQPDYNFRIFETLQYSVRHMETGAAETLCQLDIEAFLYATVRCSALQIKEQQMAIEGDLLRPPLLPLCLCKKLCTAEQQQWWEVVHSFYSKNIKDDYAKMRHILQRGIEVVRLVSNHGLSTAMVVHLAKTFDAKRRPCRARMSREDLVKSLTHGNHGLHGSPNQLACLEAWASLYWNHALTMLKCLERGNMRPTYPKVRLFDDGRDADLTPEARRDLMRDALFAVACIDMKEGRYEEAIKGFEKLVTPYASFYSAQIYKSLAQRELDGTHQDEFKQQRYTALMMQAREALYRTMDHLGGNRNHELNILLTRELDDVESKLNCTDWDLEGSHRVEGDELSGIQTPVRHLNGHHDDMSHPHSHSTPNKAAPNISMTTRQRLLLSELSNTTIQSPHVSVAGPSSAHTRPSPERLDAQIKSINYSQSQLFKMVLDRNEELLAMYSGLVSEMKDSSTQLKLALGENQTLMTNLKNLLTTNKDSMANVMAHVGDLRNCVRQLSEDTLAAKNSVKQLSDESLATIEADMAEMRESIRQLNIDYMASVQTDLADIKDTMRQLKDEFQASAAAAAVASNSSLLNAQGLATSQLTAGGFFMGSPYHPSQYPQFPQAPHVPAPGTGYRYPLLPGYPPPRAPTPAAPAVGPVTAAAARLSEQPGGTAPSSFGKFRGGDHPAMDMPTTEDEEDDEENGLCGPELNEGLLQTPGTGQYYMPSDPSLVTEWLPGAGAVTFSPQSQTQAAMPQPGYFASALRGQALQYAAAASAGAPTSLTMPGPGFFSTPTGSPASVAATQSAIASALGGKVGMAGTVPPPQPIPVIGAGAGKHIQPTVQMVDLSDPQGTAMLFHDTAKLTTSVGEIPTVDVRVVQDTVSKEGHIILCKKDTQTILSKHSIAIIKVVQSFNPLFFIWSLPSTDRKVDETYTLSFDTAEQTKRMRATVEQVIKSAGIKPSASPATGVFAAKSPGQASPLIAGAVPTPTTTWVPQASTPTITASLGTSKPSPTIPTPAAAANAGAKATLGGFTFTSAPVVKQGEDDKDGAAKPGRQLKLKDSGISAATFPPSGAAAEEAKPFAGFSFAPNKPAASAFGSVVSSTASVGSSSTVPGQAFVFGQGPAATGGNSSFGSVSNQASFKPKEGAAGFQASTQPLFSPPTSTSAVKSPGGKDDESVEEYEPNVDFKPIIELPDLVEVKTGEENETKVLSDRVKLFRFDGELNQWKERGVGELKILRSCVDTGLRFRVIMRREQVLKVCANHYISADMKLTPLSASDRAWCYTANDYAEEEMKVEKFAIKFKDSEKAGEFKSTFENCQKELSTKEGSGTAPVVAKTPESKGQSAGTKSLAEMFKPSEGSWDCPTCCINSKADILRCPACQTLNPGAKSEDVKSAPKDTPFAPASTGGFGGFKAIGNTSDSGQKQSLADMFKPSEGSWDCPTCCINSKPDVLRCPACQTLKPGVKPEDIKSAPKDAPFAPASSGGFGGFKFGGASGGEKKDVPAGGFKFGADSGGFKFGAPAAAPATASGTTEGVSASPGFKFTFGAPTTKTTASPSVTPSSQAQAQPSGFVFGGSKPGGFSFGNGQSSQPPKESGGFSFGGKPPAAAPAPSAATAAEPKSECGSVLLEQLLTSEDPPETKPSLFGTGPKQGFFAPGGSDSTSKPSGFQAKLGQVTSPTTQAEGKDGKGTTGFQFTFNLQKQQQTQQPTQQQAASPRSPEVDEKGFYLNKEGDDAHIYFEPVVPLPDKVEVKTGEEEEDVLFESRAKMYRFTSGEWKERGLGTIKILQHKTSGRIRVLMRREQVLKICCNHYITGDLDLKPMPRSEGKAWIWYAMDFTEDEGKMEQLAVRFREPDTANRFKVVFDESKEKMKTPSKAEAAMSDPTKAGTPTTKSPGNVQRKLFTKEDDSDVEFLYEETPTADQLARARELLLPDTFYLYENRPGCPGCIGCEDYDPSKSPAVPPARGQHKAAPSPATAATTPPATASKPSEKEETSGKAPPSGGMLFGGGNNMTFSALAASSAETPGFGHKDSSKPFHWAGAGQRLFGRGDGGADGSGEGDEVVSSDDIHFEPIIPLPELVEVKTGEEDWVSLFSQRAKVYGFDNTQWKERGIGEMKIMKHKTQLLFRVLLRREQVLKVAVNHLISTEMELKPMATSETAWCWVANDFTDSEPKFGQFAVKFKKQETAKEFKSIFEDCQEKLRQGATNELVQEIQVTSSSQQQTSAVSPNKAAEEAMRSIAQPVTGDKGNPYYTKELKASAQDTMVSSTQPVTGDKGNPYFSRALDVAAQDANITSTSFQPLGGSGGVAASPNFSQLLEPDTTGQASPMEIAFVSTQNQAIEGRENVFYTKQLDVASQDTMTQQSVTPLGDQGNVYHAKQLDVASQDTMTQQSVTCLGDKGNVYHTKQLDVASQDAMTQQSVTPLGDQRSFCHTIHLYMAPQDTMTQQTMTPLGDKGNVYHIKHLDVAAQHTMTQQNVTPFGDKGNIYYTKQLDVASQDTITQQSVTPIGDKGNAYHAKQLNVASQDPVTQQSVTPLGDKGNVYHARQLNVVSQDTMTKQGMTPLGDKGNVYHTKQLNVASQDTMTQQSVAPFGDKGKVYHTKQLDVAAQDTMTQKGVTPLGDKGNVYYTRQLDVAAQDAMTQQGMTPLGDKGNAYHTKQFAIAAQDTMTQQGVTPLGDEGNFYQTKQLDIPVQDTMTQQEVTLLGDKGNVCHIKQLDVAAQDTMTVQSMTPLGDEGNFYQTKQLDIPVQDTMTQQEVTLLGVKGNVCHIKQLDVAAQDTMTQQSMTPLGDKGNVYHTKQLDVSAQDTMTQQGVTPLGDKGNVYYTRELDVAALDTMTQQKQSAAGIKGMSPGSAGAGRGRQSHKKRGVATFPSSLDAWSTGADELYEDYDDEEDDDEEDDDDDESTEEEDEEERVEFEKRVTLFCQDGGQWKKLGMGNLRVLYDDDLNANKLLMLTDEGDKICNHVICMEHTVALDEKKKSCEWQPIDFATDEPIRRHFKAYFSSTQAAEEFATIFRQGQKLAAESEISSKIPEEIEVPEVFSMVDGSGGASARK